MSGYSAPTARGRRGPLFWLSAVAGWALIAWGVRGALRDHLGTKPADLARFFLAGAVVHDVLLVPVVLALGAAVARLVKGRWRAPVQAALVISGCAALFAWPEVRDYARVNHNPSSLPHNYTANLLVVVGAVAVGTVVIAVLGHRRPPDIGDQPTAPDRGSSHSGSVAKR